MSPPAWKSNSQTAKNERSSFGSLPKLVGQASVCAGLQSRPRRICATLRGWAQGRRRPQPALLAQPCKINNLPVTLREVLQLPVLKLGAIPTDREIEEDREVTSV